MKNEDVVHTICADTKIGASRLYVKPAILTEKHPNISQIAIGTDIVFVYTERLFETKKEALETLRDELERNLAAVNADLAILEIKHDILETNHEA